MLRWSDCVILFIKRKWSERVNNLTTDAVHNYCSKCTQKDDNNHIFSCGTKIKTPTDELTGSM